MYIDSVYGCYIHVYWWCIWVIYTCIIIVYMGVMYMYVDGVYECYIKRLIYDIFHIDPGINPRLPYQARQWSWRADMGRGMIPGTVWKISCHNLFIPYFTLTFNIAEKILTDKLRNKSWRELPLLNLQIVSGFKKISNNDVRKCL
jgi:hypothetical protein